MIKNKDLLLQYYLNKWQLRIDGTIRTTNSSLLQPVIYQNKKAMLKIPLVSEEVQGIALMTWWNGDGAAEVYESDHCAILLKRIENDSLTLEKLVYQGNDTLATVELCKVATKLHAKSNVNTPPLTTLVQWFESLTKNQESTNENLVFSAKLAEKLINRTIAPTVLHGDLHHQNVLFCRDSGWVVIDPKGLYGDRTFDYANILLNPTKEIALAEGRLEKQIHTISQKADISQQHLIEWTVAWAGLSAIWKIEDNLNPELPLEIIKILRKSMT